MCSTSSTDAPVSTTLQDKLAAEIVDLRRRLELQEQETRRQANAYQMVRDNLQDALLEADESDRETLKDFLEAATPWEFKITKRYRARFTVEVTFDAASQAEADDISLDVSQAYGSNHLEDFEVEDISVESIDED